MLLADTKVEEARYFLGEMQRVVENRDFFVFELSAFLSACRSVDYYLVKEMNQVVGKENGKAWWNDVKARVDSGIYAYVSFFINKRNENIHDSPLQPQPLKRLVVSDTNAQSTENVVIIKLDSQNNLMGIHEETLDRPGQVVRELPWSQIDSYHFQEGDQDSQDILITCRRYLEELEEIVEEARIIIEKALDGKP